MDGFWDAGDSYPIVLRFTCPQTNEKFEKVINNDGQAEDVFHWLFSRWGYEIAYSINDL
jgi:hypothetical protein